MSIIKLNSFGNSLVLILTKTNIMSFKYKANYKNKTINLVFTLNSLYKFFLRHKFVEQVFNIHEVLKAFFKFTY